MPLLMEFSVLWLCVRKTDRKGRTSSAFPRGTLCWAILNNFSGMTIPFMHHVLPLHGFLSVFCDCWKEGYILIEDIWTSRVAENIVYDLQHDSTECDHQLFSSSTGLVQYNRSHVNLGTQKIIKYYKINIDLVSHIWWKYTDTIGLGFGKESSFCVGVHPPVILYFTGDWLGSRWCSITLIIQQLWIIIIHTQRHLKPGSWCWGQSRSTFHCHNMPLGICLCVRVCVYV